MNRRALVLVHMIRRFLARYGPEGCWFGQAWLAQKLKRTPRTIQRWIAALKKAGLIAVRRRYKKTNVYSLLQPKMSSQNVVTELPSGVSLNLRRERTEHPTVEYVWPRRAVNFLREKLFPKRQSLYDRLKSQGFQGFV